VIGRTAFRDPMTAEFIRESSHAMTFLQKKEAADPFAFMRRVTEELDRAFGFRPDVPGAPAFSPKMWAPEIEVFERDEKFVVRVDLPGLTKEDVKIEVSHDELTIEGKGSSSRSRRKRAFIAPSARTASSTVASGFRST
jgi:HSP20 family molecular chaperone IbpA